MKFYLMAVFLGCVFFQQTFQQMGNKPLVTVFYESLCPFSIRFIKNILYPVYTDLGTYIQVDFIPYGLVKKEVANNTWTYDCQHGPEECAINKLQVCGIVKTSHQNRRVEYVYCIESDADTTTDVHTLAKCASKLELPEDEVLKCTEGPESNQLFGLFGDRQKLLAPNLRGVPTVHINNTNLDDYTTLKKTLCDMLHNEPEGCSKSIQK